MNAMSNFLSNKDTVMDLSVLNKGRLLIAYKLREVSKSLGENFVINIAIGMKS